jgi:hypothetical protein
MVDTLAAIALRDPQLVAAVARELTHPEPERRRRAAEVVRYGEIIEAVMDSLQEAGALRNGRLRDSHSRMGLDLVIGTLVRAGGDYPIEDVRVELHHAVDLFLDGALKPGA